MPNSSSDGTPGGDATAKPIANAKLSQALLDEVTLSNSSKPASSTSPQAGKASMPVFHLNPSSSDLQHKVAERLKVNEDKRAASQSPEHPDGARQPSTSSALDGGKERSTFGQRKPDEAVASASASAFTSPTYPPRRRRIGSALHDGSSSHTPNSSQADTPAGGSSKPAESAGDSFSHPSFGFTRGRLASVDGMSPRNDSVASGSPMARRRTTVRHKDGSGFDRGVRLYSPAETDALPDPRVPPPGIFSPATGQPHGSPGATTRKRSTMLWNSPVGSTKSPPCDTEDFGPGIFGNHYKDADCGESASSSQDSPMAKPASTSAFGYYQTVSSREGTPRASPALGVSATNLSMGDNADSISSMSEASVDTKPQKGLLLPTHDEEVVDIDEVIQACIDNNSSSLELYDTHLTVVPMEIFAYCCHITSLDLSDNELTAIPPEIGLLDQLQRLTLKSNSLTALPEEIGECTQLTHLYIDQNQLTGLPDSFAQLQLLEVLGLDWNEIQGYPTASLQLPRLERLYIVENPDIQLPDADAWEGCSEHIVSLDNRPSFMQHVKQLKASGKCAAKFEWNAIYPDKIVDHIYLGSLRSAQDLRIYQELKIEYLASIGRELTVVLGDTMQHIQCNVDDLPNSDLSKIFETVHGFIDEAVDSKKTVLVHCFKGQSRSATIVITWLMRRLRITRDEAYAIVKAQRPMINPNQGFMDLMLRYEATLKEQWTSTTGATVST